MFRKGGSGVGISLTSHFSVIDGITAANISDEDKTRRILFYTLNPL